MGAVGTANAMVMMEVAGSISQTASMVFAQALKDAGFTVDQQVIV